MYESYTEHKFNYIQTGQAVKPAHCVCETNGGDKREPPLDEKVSLIRFLPKIPKLLCIFKGTLVNPSARSQTTYNFADSNAQIRGKEKNVFLFSPFTHYTDGTLEKSIPGMVRFLPSGICEQQDNNYGTFGDVEYPSSYGTEKNLCWGNHNKKKILNYIRPHQDSIYGGYTSLPSQCFSVISPEDWYIYDNNSSKSAA